MLASICCARKYNWQLDACRVCGRQSDVVRRLQDFILNTRNVAVTESAVSIKPLDRSEINFDSLYLNLGNTDSQHHLQVQVRLNGQASPSLFAVTMEGEPGSDYTASAYANISDLDLMPFVASFLPASWAWQTTSTSATLWADINQSGLQSLRGKLTNGQVQAIEAEGTHEIAVQNAAATFALNRSHATSTSPDGWSVYLQDIDLIGNRHHGNCQQSSCSFLLMQAVSCTLHASQLDLAMLAQIANSALPLPARAANALQILQPRGLMQNATITSAFDGSYPGGFLLRSNLQNVAVEAWQGAPSGSGINGFVQADNRSGFVELDSDDFDIRLPQLFAQTWHYDHINARVGWQLDNGEVRIQSSVIDLANASLSGRVQFELYNTRNSQNVRESDLSVLVGMLNIDVAARAAYLPTLPNLRETMIWLEAGVQDGQITNNGSFCAPQPSEAHLLQRKITASWYNIKNGRLRFYQSGRRSKVLAGHVEARDADVDVSTTTGTIAGIRFVTGDGHCASCTHGWLSGDGQWHCYF